MKIEHVGLWVKDLEALKTFYVTYFNAHPGDKYTNTHKQFSSYFLSFNNSAVRLELMQKTGITEAPGHRGTYYGWAHLAIEVASRDLVHQLTGQLAKAGYTVVSQPRLTGDGYYESVVLDPEGNQVEVCSAFISS